MYFGMMRRRGFKALLFYSISSVKPLKDYTFFPRSLSTIFPFSFKISGRSYAISCRNLFFISKYATFSSPDELQGLVDPEDSVTSESSRDDYFSADEVGFLRDSLLHPNANGGSSTQSIKPGMSSNDAILMSDAIQKNEDGFGDKTQKFLRQFRDKLNENLVVEVLNLVNIPELVIKFFMWAGRQIGYCHTGRVYNALLESLEHSNNDKVPETLLREIKEHDKEVLGKLLNVLIRKYCRNGMWNIALEELGRLKDFGYKPTRLTYNALIHVFLLADRLDTSYLIHREMSDSGFSMDEFAVGSFAYSLCKVGKWRDALALIEKEDIVPNTNLYNKMISGLCEASLFEVAIEFLDRMRSSSYLPNVVTYRILLSGCLKKKQLGRCKRILGMMIIEGCYPSYSIFNSLVHAYCKSGEYSYSYKLIRKMAKCGCKPGYVVYNIFIGAICGVEESPSSDALVLAEKAYAEMLSAGLVLNKVNVTNFARHLCGAGKFEKAYNIIREMMGNGFIPDMSSYSNVIGFLCNASQVEKAFLLFGEMKRNNVVPDVYTYTILIDNFCKGGLVDQARSWFDEMVRDGCAPNVVTYTALIHAYLKGRKVAIANELFEMMLSEGCIPNVVTYTALIDGFCKTGDTEKACQIYERMRGSVDAPAVDMYFNSNTNKLDEPNVVTYGALIDGLCKASKTKHAHDLLNVMLVEGCEPNHIVYDALIDGFCKAGNLEEAQMVFAKMSERGYFPNVYTYSSLIDRLFKDKRLDFVLKVLSKMLENSCSPNVVIYTEMIDGLCKVGKMDEAYKLKLMMEEKGCNPNVVTYTAIIDAFGKAGKFDRCFELFIEMGSKGCSPNFVTYSVMIKHLCAAGRLDDAHELLDEMKQTYWPKYISGYCKVIEGFSREFIASIGLLEEMNNYDSVPIIPLYRVLIDNFVKAGRLEMALELYSEIKLAPLVAPAHKYLRMSLIESLSQASKVDEAFELYSDMTRRGAVPEVGTFVHLIKGLFRVNRWKQAFELSEIICRMVCALTPP